MKMNLDVQGQGRGCRFFLHDIICETESRADKGFQSRTNIFRNQ
jgi:hypothetical protein